MTLLSASAVLLALLGVAAIGYTLIAALLALRLAGRAPPRAAPPEPVTLLKPLHGAEPRLAANLASFLDQRWAAPIELLAGIARADDPANAAVLALGPDGGARSARLIVTGASSAANAKIANVAALGDAAAHDVLILSDSDMAVTPDYVAGVVAALGGPGVGAVTCLYRGRGDAGRWSRLAAAAISYQFLPSVLVALASGAGAPCMGSTIALRRATLARIGGFRRFADTLADDHAIGAAVRAAGLRVAVPAMVLVHGCAETSLPALLRHELRWAATVRGVTPLPVYAGQALTYPLPLALLAAAVAPAWGLALLGGALASRWLLARAIDRLCGARTAGHLLLPARDLLGFSVFCASFFVRSVDWRGARLAVRPDGRIVAR